ncbi:cation:proton antiporter [Lutimaribacter sp. EGI FJ00015]|uniref:Cation:proton antiporter n=1 Tax=Lutimaribacter degradans TaxID=2945989 RepID=A0ACC5ZU00_9RHOB|nr:cation:proton antiporter [Lutimaribacter sp. EGI FJ00013]MCM2561024.1 cation:proton antiporter [Lutimaribacter sp. EGI FJ00013]MCO0612029.1 cation:proton antiporter [Lutimaribacter sp. EGI FJ00015]MCO0634851.1 cation:proton antiporter [Lutimaribacter sp. EGI FJ00014]
MSQELAPIFLMIGGIFGLGLLADSIARRTALPRVSLLLLSGVLLGGAGLDLLPRPGETLQNFLSTTALTMVAFLLGSSLSLDTLRSRGRAILALSLAIVGMTLALVALGLWAMGVPLGLALLLAAIATATDPAAVQDVIAQSRRDTRFTRTLAGVVAIDDAWGLVAFSLIVLAVQQVSGTTNGADIPLHLARDILGSVLLGVAIGLPGAWLTGRIEEGEPLLIEGLALVFLLSGAALALDLSYLIAGMTAGMVLVNTARHHERAFHEIEHARWPFLVLFFVLAGAALDLAALAALGAAGVAYIALRITARVIGGWLGAALGGSPAPERALYGAALLPQAGVAVGTALVAAQEFPQWGETIMAMTIGATVLFELLGPPAALWAIRKSGRQD